ncbi:uncharacterized protein BDZ99DRAFT_514156 [Mytilinidion resinicola]|uniref:Uncharacterized protein n=1 Tax=Mytilinidion resinicola TaxID=574789 RepID=A0A6A6ZCA3_9PEZI|nr:uncharacterized protein BDZ99DRAFT_514156 [Mytilinidion resinicola]KAF2817935.1 hypothetical protein BDZ99DRAFT_514156 [Mytilinidion resinicola]
MFFLSCYRRWASFSSLLICKPSGRSWKSHELPNSGKDHDFTQACGFLLITCDGTSLATERLASPKDDYGNEGSRDLCLPVRTNWQYEALTTSLHFVFIQSLSGLVPPDILLHPPEVMTKSPLAAFSRIPSGEHTVFSNSPWHKWRWLDGAGLGKGISNLVLEGLLYWRCRRA